MGIKELNTFLLKNTRNSINEVMLKELANKKVAIDTSIFMYRFKYKNGNLKKKFLEQINRLRMNNILPIYIFDGKPPSEKDEILKARKQTRDKNKEKQIILEQKIEKGNLDETEQKKLKTDLEKMVNSSFKITKEDILMIKTFFDTLKIPYLQASGEADILCAHLYKNKLVNMVMSEDMDFLTGQCGVLLRNFNLNSNKIMLYNLENILKELDIDYDRFVKMCILFGCDYVKRINRIGPQYSFDLIKNKLKPDHGNISLDDGIDEIIEIIKKKPNIIIPDNYKEKFKKAYNIFTSDFEYEIKNKLNIEITDKEKNIILEYLVNDMQIGNVKAKNRLENIYKL